jgi:hypothetical protein
MRLFCKDSASREQYKKSALFFIAEAPPILSKDSASRILVFLTVRLQLLILMFARVFLI